MKKVENMTTDELKHWALKTGLSIGKAARRGTLPNSARGHELNDRLDELRMEMLFRPSDTHVDLWHEHCNQVGWSSSAASFDFWA